MGTQDYVLIYKGESRLRVYACTDSDWASNPKDQRLQTGYFIIVAGDAFSWVSKAQRTVALSSTEVEYMALSDCAQQCVWIHSILLEIGYSFGPIPISRDNQGSIFMASNPITESQNKHINVCFHAI